MTHADPHDGQPEKEHARHEHRPLIGNDPHGRYRQRADDRPDPGRGVEEAEARGPEMEDRIGEVVFSTRAAMSAVLVGAWKAIAVPAMQAVRMMCQISTRLVVMRMARASFDRGSGSLA